MAQQTIAQYKGHDYVNSIHPDRWDGIVRPYTPADVERLRNPIRNDPTLARKGAERFFYLNKDGKIISFGVDNPVEAENAVRGGNKVAYGSGWMIAANANSEAVSPDMGLYSFFHGVDLVRRLNNAYSNGYRTDKSAGRGGIDWNIPIVSDLESGWGGINSVYAVASAMIREGSSAIHIEDQDPSQRRCGHMGGKVIIPTASFIKKLVASRLTADILGVPTYIIARTDALNAKFIANYTDAFEGRDGRYIRGRAEDELYPFGDPNGDGKNNLEAAIERALAYAPYADSLWMETGKPDIGVAREFAQAIHEEFPGKHLAYNLSPSFDWRAHLNDEQMRKFIPQLQELGFTYNFSTLPTWRDKGISAFELAQAFHDPQKGVLAIARIQDREREGAQYGYVGVLHQKAVGEEWFDKFGQTVTGGALKTAAGGDGSTQRDFRR